MASSWWGWSIHPLSFDTRYLFSQFIGYNGCPAESLSFIPLSFILYHLIQYIYFHKSLVIIGVQLNLYPLSLYPSSFTHWYKICLWKFLGYHRCPAESLSFILASGLFWHRSWPAPALFRQHPSHLPIFCLHRHQTKANTNTINYTHLLLPALILWSKSINSHRLLSA